MKNPHSSLVWEMSFSILDLQGCPKAFCVTQSWAPNLSGPGLLSGPGSKRRRRPQLTWKAVCVGAMQLDRLPVLGLGFRGPGAKGEDSPKWVFWENLACHQLM